MERHVCQEVARREVHAVPHPRGHRTKGLKAHIRVRGPALEAWPARRLGEPRIGGRKPATGVGRAGPLRGLFLVCRWLFSVHVLTRFPSGELRPNFLQNCEKIHLNRLHRYPQMFGRIEVRKLGRRTVAWSSVGSHSPVWRGDPEPGAPRAAGRWRDRGPW